VQRALIRGIGDIRRHTEIEEKFDGVRPIGFARCEERLGGSSELGMCVEQGSRGAAIQAEAGCDQGFHRSERYRDARCAVLREKVRDLVTAKANRLLV
jgi:hypothetical protein